MKIPSDIEIAQSSELKPIVDIASKLGITEDELELYGKYKAKVSPSVWERVKDDPDGKLILVTAMPPLLQERERPLLLSGFPRRLPSSGRRSVSPYVSPSGTQLRSQGRSGWRRVQPESFQWRT